MAMWRVETVKAEEGHRSNASVYNEVREGLMTRPVPIGSRAVAWPDYEVRAIVAARIAGKTGDEIRALVDRLHAQRQALGAPVESASACVATGAA